MKSRRLGKRSHWGGGRERLSHLSRGRKKLWPESASFGGNVGTGDDSWGMGEKNQKKRVSKSRNQALRPLAGAGRAWKQKSFKGEIRRGERGVVGGHPGGSKKRGLSKKNGGENVILWQRKPVKGTTTQKGETMKKPGGTIPGLRRDWTRRVFHGRTKARKLKGTKDSTGGEERRPGGKDMKMENGDKRKFNKKGYKGIKKKSGN